MSAEAELRQLGTPERSVKEKAYLKSQLEFYGATVPAIHSFAKRLVTSTHFDRAVLLYFVEALWSRPVHELHMLAIDVLTLRASLLEACDIAVVEQMLRTSHTWAYVDSLAVDVAGRLVERDPGLLATLDRWSVDDDFWVRRAAMLAQLRAFRRGEGDLDRFFRYASQMINETEFFIRKAIGWVLREISKSRPEPVREFLSAHIDTVSGLTLREGSKYLAEGEREALLGAYRSRPKLPR